MINVLFEALGRDSESVWIQRWARREELGDKYPVENAAACDSPDWRIEADGIHCESCDRYMEDVMLGIARRDAW